MKKLIALFAALVLCLSMASAAFAEEDILTLNWADFQSVAEQMDPNGEVRVMFYLNEGKEACGMWIPSVFEAEELTDEDFEDGLLAFLCTEDETAFIEVFQMDIGGGSLEDFAAVADEYGYTEVEPVIINGIPCLTMMDEENDAAVLVFTTNAGAAIGFAFDPISDENFAAVVEIMMVSIQPIEL